MQKLQTIARAILTYILISIILTNVIEIAGRRQISGGFDFFSNSPLAAGITSAVILAMCLLLDAFVGRRFIGCLLLFVLLSVVGFSNAEKQKLLTDPLFPWDFLFVDQIIDLIPDFLAEQPLKAALIAFSIIFSLAGIIYAWRFSKLKLIRVPAVTRVVMLVLSITILIPFGYGGTLKGRDAFKSYLGLTNSPNLQVDSYKKNGFLVAFLLNTSISFVDAPEAYSSREIEAITSNLPRPTHTNSLGEKPNVVMIMSEAFWDPTNFPGITFDTDPMPFVRASISGKIFSPVFGGGTSNVEFEALTGFSNAFLPQGSFPYSQYVMRKLPALPWYFQSLGYRTIALHPYHKWFWNRQKAYPRMGFQQFISLEEIEHPRNLGPRVSDEQVTDIILSELKPDEPTFLFAVTMQNHTPFAPKRYGSDQIMPKGNLSEGEAEVLSSYAQGILYSDKALERLVKSLEKRERPTVLIFFGDHGPVLGDQSIYKTSGLTHSDNARKPESTLRLRSTPLVVWSSKTGFVKSIGTISPALLPNILMEQLELYHPFYRTFLGKFKDKIHINDRSLIMTKYSSFDSKLSAQLKPLLESYYLLQYDQMFGSQHSKEALFCETVTKNCYQEEVNVAIPQ